MVVVPLLGDLSVDILAIKTFKPLSCVFQQCYGCGAPSKLYCKII